MPKEWSHALGCKDERCRGLLTPDKQVLWLARRE